MPLVIFYNYFGWRHTCNDYRILFMIKKYPEKNLLKNCISLILLAIFSMLMSIMEHMGIY